MFDRLLIFVQRLVKIVQGIKIYSVLNKNYNTA